MKKSIDDNSKILAPGKYEKKIKRLPDGSNIATRDMLLRKNSGYVKKHEEKVTQIRLRKNNSLHDNDDAKRADKQSENPKNKRASSIVTNQEVKIFSEKYDVDENPYASNTSNYPEEEVKTYEANENGSYCISTEDIRDGIRRI